MANTRPDVVIPADQWIDLYEVTEIPLGTAVDIYNKGSGYCLIAIGPEIPSPGTGVPLFEGRIGSYMGVDPDEEGLWAYSPLGTRLLVQEY